ncbi:hypothetical protein LOTGIDRAFT_195260, partial [Lottia gigantea]
VVPHRSSSASSSPRAHQKSNHLRKWGSLNNSADLNSSLTSHSAREPNWNQDEGYLKIYIKGRGIALYAPSEVTDFDVSKVGDAPNEKLQLEW